MNRPRAWTVLLLMILLTTMSCGTKDKGDPNIPWNSGQEAADPLKYANEDCGPNSCGGQCGECPWPQVCASGTCYAGSDDVGEGWPECNPDCDMRECGPDGCGGLCGSCEDGFECDDYQCILPCQPNCSGLVCGSDGCGGTCGKCPTGWTCEWGQTLCLEPGHEICDSGLSCTCSPCGTTTCDFDCPPPDPPDDICGPKEVCLSAAGVCAPMSADICDPVKGLWCLDSYCYWKCSKSSTYSDEPGWGCCPDPSFIKHARGCTGQKMTEGAKDPWDCWDWVSRPCQGCCGKADYPNAVFYTVGVEYADGWPDYHGEEGCCGPDYPYPCDYDHDKCCSKPTCD